MRGCNEEEPTTTSFDMLVRNEMSDYQLAILALRSATRLRSHAGPLIDKYVERLAVHRVYIRQNDEDLREVRDWRRSASPLARQATDGAPAADGTSSAKRDVSPAHSAKTLDERTIGQTGDQAGGHDSTKPLASTTVQSDVRSVKKDRVPDVNSEEAQPNS